MDLHHLILIIDEGKQALSLVDTGSGHFHWTLELGERFPLARELQRLDEARVLVGFDRGFFELDWRSGEVLLVVDRWREVTAVSRRPDGSTLVCGVGLEGEAGVTALTVDAGGGLIGKVSAHGDYVRLVRETPAGTYLLCTNDHILETTAALEPLRRFAAPGFEHAWKALRQPDGSTWVSAGYGAFLAVFDSSGALVKSFGRATEVAPEVRPFFYAAFEFPPEGGVLVANWQGHGAGNGHLGRQLLQFDSEGALVGSWSDPARISSLQGLLVIDWNKEHNYFQKCYR